MYRLAQELSTLRGKAPLATRLCLSLANMLPDFAMGSLRTALYRLAGCKCTREAVVLGRSFLVGSGNFAPRLALGQGCMIAPNCTFGLDSTITLGQNVSISPGVTLYTATHGIGFGSRRMAATVGAKPIIVEKGVWVGMHALILPGVTLGHGCVVSAGAVVFDSVAPNTLVAGNPAVVVRELPFGDR
jgi:acetyltransferase-like isoleucine patch superfamily enzyme